MKKIIAAFRHLPINLKVFLTYIVFVAVIGGAATLLVALNEKLVIQQGHVALAQNISENVSPMLAIQHKMMLNRVVNIVDRLADVRDCAVVDQDDIAVAHTDLAMLGNTMVVGPEIHQAFAKKGYYFFVNPENRTEAIYAPVFEAGNYLGSVLLSFDSADLLSFMRSPREGTVRIIRNVVIFVALFGLLGAIIITRLISYPVRLLTRKVHGVLQGNFPQNKLPANQILCWEELNCNQTGCPAYKNHQKKCWTVAGTFCKGGPLPGQRRRFADCRDCPVYRKNSGDELSQLNDGFDIMVQELLDSTENMKRAKEDLEKYAAELEAANRRNMEMRIYHEQILDSLSSAVISLDENLIIRKYNQAAQTILGVDLQELLGNNIAEVQQECTRCADFFGLILQAIRQYQEDGNPLIGNEVSVRKLSGGSITLSLSLLPLLGCSYQRRPPLIVTFEDITERERMREELNLSKNLAELGEVAAKVAHDVRNPLNAIEGGIHYLINKYKANPEILDISNLIRGQVSRLDSVTRDLLEISKPMLTNFSLCDVNQLVDESSSFLAAELSRGGLTLHKEFSAGIPAIAIDPNLLQRALINLLENAIEATGSGGTITLKTRLLISSETSNWIELAISDTGRGIPNEISEAVFKPFYTTKVSGTGLGLSIVRQVVTQHRGDIEIRPRDPQPGTEIIIHLPANTTLKNQGTCHVQATYNSSH